MTSNETDQEKATVKAWDDVAQDALNRMQRAARRKTGCYLTADMIAALELTCVGSLFLEADPRPNKSKD